MILLFWILKIWVNLKFFITKTILAKIHVAHFKAHFMDILLVLFQIFFIYYKYRVF